MKRQPVKTQARKYVRFADGVVKTFPKTGNHGVEAGKRMSTPLSAGVYDVKDGKVRVFGSSHTLKIKPMPGDARLLQGKI